MKKKQLTPARELELIRKKLGHYSTQWKPRVYLDTGSTYLNSVFGIESIGLPYGKITELSGPESHGKSGMTIDLAALAQRDGAGVTWIDPEESWDDTWASARGVNVRRVALIQPYVGIFSKEKEERPITAEELCEEAEEIIRRRMHRYEKQFVALDSVTALLTREELWAGLSNQNMRTDMSLPKFLGKLLRRWVGLAQNANAMIVFINQLRVSPTQMYGNPEYTPGGKALKFYSHVRVTVRRVKGGRMLRQSKVIGIKGILTNTKNKVGGVEGTKCGYKMIFKGGATYMNAEKVSKEARGEVGSL